MEPQREKGHLGSLLRILCILSEIDCRGAVGQWVHAGFLAALSGPGINNHSEFVFDRLAIEDWHRNHISAAEAKQVLGVGDAMMSKWRHEGRLTRLVSDPKMPGFYNSCEFALSLRFG